VSSTRIRTALVRGDVKSAARMLGRPYSVAGLVSRGEGRGRQLTYPTANLEIEDARKMLPSRGIYAVRVGLGSRQAPGALYIGTKPTFGGRTESVEVHILGRKSNLYGRRLEVSFVQRLRDDEAFRDEAALKKAIARDIARTRKILST
jgi:riboflavin kinase/FMN adenylyltransferase